MELIVKETRIHLLVLIDFVSALLFFLVLGVPLWISAWAARSLGSWVPSFWFWILSPAVLFVGAFSLVFTTFLCRMCLPSLKEGSFEFPADWTAKAWVIRLALQRILFHPFIWGFLCSFFCFRFLTLKALGADIPYDFQAAINVAILDPEFLVAAENVQLGSDVIIASHYVDHSKLVIKKVFLGRGVTIYGKTLIMPGSEIDDDVTIGLDCIIGVNCKIGQKSYLQAGCLLGTGVTIGKSVKIGPRAVIGAGATVLDGAVIEAGAVIEKGAVVQAEVRGKAE